MNDVPSGLISGLTEGGNFPPTASQHPYSEVHAGNNDESDSSPTQSSIMQEFDPAAHGLDPEFRLTKLADMKG